MRFGAPSLTISALALCAACQPRTSGHDPASIEPRPSRDQKEEPVAEAAVRQRVDDFAKAVRAKDIERVLVVHDHVSVPADLGHGRAVLDLTP